MTSFGQVLEVLRPGLPLLVTLVLVLGGLILIRQVLERRFGANAGGRFRVQLVMLTLTAVGVLAVIIALPVSETLRGQLLSLLGILLSASIALSSTTFLGNAMAGVLLRVSGAFSAGDFIQVEQHFGRVSGRGLFHTEVQTEDRDLTTLPNLYLVSNPVKVVHSTGTIVSAEVSLGYDLPRQRVEQALLEAADKAGLDEPFVQIVALGDFSVTYRAAGLLVEVKRILSARSGLRGFVIDELHAAGFEIVSPSFMNTRAFESDSRFVPPDPSRSPSNAGDTSSETGPEAVVFDKADAAANLEDLRQKQKDLRLEIETGEKLLREARSDDEKARLESRLAAAKDEHLQLTRQLESLEAAEDSEN